MGRRRPAGLIDANEILVSTGAVPYVWQVGTDELIWGPNAAAALDVPEPELLANGRAYARLIEPQDGRTRFDAVMNSGAQDDGAGVPYQMQYALRPTPDSAPLHWIEDTGRWFAGADGKPARAHGIVRVINERHEQEQQLAYLSRFDALTGEMNRWHLTEVLEPRSLKRPSCASSCGFMLVAIDNLGAHQRVLRLRRRRRGDRARSPSACAPRCAARISSAAFPATSSASS